MCGAPQHSTMPPMRKALLLAITCVALAASAQTSQPPAPDTSNAASPMVQSTAGEGQQAVRTVLDTQVAAWNRGDLEGYMAGYWNSPELTFFSGGTITKGWQPTLERYRKRYQSGGREMGKLDFTETTIDMLSPDSAVARGRWHLAMKNGQQPKGVFTVMFRKFPEGWKIVHDHSSAD
jgi:ketosteroid isomerase-like protein